jgi:anti-anti-sigma factor
MEMTIETLSDGVTKVNLVGRLDIAAALKIDMQFNIVSGSKRKVIVDIEHVSFLASIGIRTIVTGAKTAKSKGGQMVLLKPMPDVEKVLITSGIDTIIPILHDLDSAVRAVSG